MMQNSHSESWEKARFPAASEGPVGGVFLGRAAWMLQSLKLLVLPRGHRSCGHTSCALLRGRLFSALILSSFRDSPFCRLRYVFVVVGFFLIYCTAYFCLIAESRCSVCSTMKFFDTNFILSNQEI